MYELGNQSIGHCSLVVRERWKVKVEKLKLSDCLVQFERDRDRLRTKL